MSNQDTYIMVVASLPHLSPLFTEKQTPISRFRLDKRLRLLSVDDRALVDAVERALEWRSIAGDVSDADVLARARHVFEMTTRPTIRRVVERRMQIRTCIAALRHRAAGRDAPATTDNTWGYGRVRNQITRQWTAPAFGLERHFPWLLEANERLTQGDTYGLERLILTTVYQDLSRQGAQQHFTLEAVVIYVLKWSLIDRWSRYNAEAASRRFNRLLNASLQTAANAAIPSDTVPQPTGAST